MDVFAQLTATGLVNGMIYALIAFAYIAIFRVTNVVNIALGEFLMLGGFLYYTFDKAGLPWPVAVVFAVAAAGLAGLVMHRSVIQPAGRKASVEALVTMTIGASLLLIGLAQLIWGSDAVRAAPFTGGPPVAFLGVSLPRQAFWLLGLGAVVCIVLWLFFARTTLGLGLRATADSLGGADLVGINAWTMGRIAFALGCAVAGLAGVLLVPLGSVSFGVGFLLSFKGFTAAILGGLRSYPAAIGGGLVLGLLESYTVGYGSSAYRDVATLAVLLVVLIVRPQGFTRGPKPTATHQSASSVVAQLVDGSGGLRRHWRTLVVAVILMALAPYIVSAATLSSLVFAGQFAIVAVGVVLLLGYTGQITLGHAVLMAVGGYASAVLTLQHGWPPVLALLAGIVVSCVIAWLVARVVFRFAGFYLGMFTLGLVLIFTSLISQPNDITGGAGGLFGVLPLSLFGLQVVSDKANFYLAWVVTLVVIVLALQLIHSRFGRAMRAIKDSEPAAIASGVDPAKMKRQVFVIGAGLAAIGGSLYVHYASIADPGSFDLSQSVNILAMVVIGGQATVWGAPLGSLFLNVLPHGLQTVIPGQQAGQVGQVIFGLLLMVLLVARPDGLAGLLARLRKLVIWATSPLAPRVLRRHGGTSSDEAASSRARPGGSPKAATEVMPHRLDVQRGTPLLTVQGLTKSFGGLRALQPLDLVVDAGSITALIGPNGAGKSTAFNCISGALPPDAGSVVLGGERLDGLAPHTVVEQGLSRTFQNVALFGTMTALENVMVGCHSWTTAGVGSAVVRAGRHRSEEREITETARYWLDYVGLSDYADRPSGTLPFGHQRLLEIARSLASRPKILLLDEPAAGLNRIEKNGLSELLLDIQRMGLTVLLVEHDMTLVMNVAETVVVLDHGTVLAHGTPAEVRQDQGVIEAYLGAHA